MVVVGVEKWGKEKGEGRVNESLIVCTSDKSHQYQARIRSHWEMHKSYSGGEIVEERKHIPQKKEQERAWSLHTFIICEGATAVEI